MDNPELARRWVSALGKDAWADGMRVLATGQMSHGRLTVGTFDTLILSGDRGSNWYVPGFDRWYVHGEAWPDFADPATRGAMLGILRRLFSDTCAHLTATEDRGGALMWHLTCVARCDHYASAATEAECLVLAAESWRATQDKSNV